MNTDNERLLNSYGLLLTVLSLLCIVVYSGDPYDAWDTLLGFLALIFTSLYFNATNGLRIFELALVSLIMSLGIVAIVFSLGEYLNPSAAAVRFHCENNICEAINNTSFFDKELFWTLALSLTIGVLFGLVFPKIEKFK